MKPPLIAGFLIVSFLACGAGTPLDFLTQEYHGVTFTHSLWKRCIVGASNEICSTEILSTSSSSQPVCGEFSTRIQVARAFSILACVFLFATAAVATARISSVAVRQSGKVRLAIRVMGVLGSIFCIIQFSVTFTFFTQSFCNSVAFKDTAAASLGPAPFLFVVGFVMSAVGLALEICMADDARLTEHGGAAGGAFSRPDDGYDDDDDDGTAVGRELTVAFTYTLDSGLSATDASSLEARAPSRPQRGNSQFHRNSSDQQQATATNGMYAPSATASTTSQEHHGEGSWTLL